MHTLTTLQHFLCNYFIYHHWPESINLKFLNDSYHIIIQKRFLDWASIIFLPIIVLILLNISCNSFFQNFTYFIQFNNICYYSLQHFHNLLYISDWFLQHRIYFWLLAFFYGEVLLEGKIDFYCGDYSLTDWAFS